MPQFIHVLYFNKHPPYSCWGSLLKIAAPLKQKPSRFYNRFYKAAQEVYMKYKHKTKEGKT